MNTATLLPTIVAVLMIALVIWLGKSSALLKDQLIPQIPPNRQTYSLARSQMAFWFVVILISFIYLFLRFHTVNVITPQALTLMGVSALTAGGGAVADNVRDTPEDSLNDALKALGLSSYQDVVALQHEIDRLKASGSTLTDSDKVTLNDKQLLLQIYENRTKPFETAGWLKDLITDRDGTALHRLQALVWTILLGGVFICQVYGSKGMMPQWDDSILALMGISNAGYVGFKFNEVQY